jgi:hypothetical protein
LLKRGIGIFAAKENVSLVLIKKPFLGPDHLHNFLLQSFEKDFPDKKSGSMQLRQLAVLPNTIIL